MTFPDELKALREKATKGPFEVVILGYKTTYTVHEFIETKGGIAICGAWNPAERNQNLRLLSFLANHAEAIEELVRAAHQTLEENLDLADGDECTLKVLRDALVKFEAVNTP